MKLAVLAVVLFAMLVALFTQTNAALTTKAIKSTLDAEEVATVLKPQVKMSVQGREYCWAVFDKSTCRSMGCRWDRGCRP